jgi:hypothetical protein
MPHHQHSDPFDELTKQPDFTDEQLKQFQKLDYLIHQTFAQNKAGAELLELWVENALLRTPTAMVGMTELEIGIAEGQKTFIRNILLTVEKVNNDG